MLFNFLDLKPLIYCHGLLGHQDECLPLLEALSAKYEVFRFNFSGHGGDPLREEWSVELFAADLRAFIKANAIENPVILGYSLGGYVALYAILNLHIPCKKLYTIGTKWFWDEAVSAGEVAKLNADKIAEKVPQLAEKWSVIHAPNDWRKLLDFCKAFIVKMPAVAFSQAQLNSVQVPVVVSVGDMDKFVTSEESVQVANSLPFGNYNVIPDTPHPIEKLNIAGFVNIAR